MTSAREFDPIAHLLQRWRAVAMTTAAGLAIAVTYALLAPKWYEATLTVVQSQRSQESAASALAARLPSGLDSISTDVQRIRAVLVSNSVSDAVIDRFNLKDRYETPYIEQARAALWSHCSANVDKKGGIVTLACEDQDPKVAMEMTAYFGEVANRVFRRVAASSAHEERQFLEAQVLKARQDVDESSRRLREFQEKHKIVDLPEQSKAVISAMAQIQGELISKQLELSYLTSFSSRTESSVVQLQQQIGIMEAKLAQLEAERVGTQPAPSAGSGSGTGRDFFPAAMSVPAIRYELEQLLRQQKIHETLFFMLTQRFEMAKVDEARDTSTFQILDYPTLPTYKSRPRRVRIVALGFALSLAVSCLLFLGPAWLRERRLRPNPT
jgi:capsule polysaccharide export protein KpsE/RkpR